MKALCIRHPWAALVAAGHKTIEVRTWSTRYRGPLVIVASGKLPAFEDLDASNARALLSAPIGSYGWDAWEAKTFPTQVTIAMVDLVDVRPWTQDDASASICDGAGCFAWVLESARTVPQRAVKGRLGLFNVEGELR